MGGIWAIIMFVAAENVKYEVGIYQADIDLVRATLIGIGIGYLLGCCVHIYFWLCVYSFYKKVKEGEIGPHSRA